MRARLYRDRRHRPLAPLPQLDVLDALPLRDANLQAPIGLTRDELEEAVLEQMIELYRNSGLIADALEQLQVSEREERESVKCPGRGAAPATGGSEAVDGQLLPPSRQAR